MKELPTGSVDLVLTDIPYGIPELGSAEDYRQRLQRDIIKDPRKRKSENHPEIQKRMAAKELVNKITFDLEEVAKEAIRISSGWVIIFCDKEQISPIVSLMRGHGLTRLLIWKKPNPLPLHASRTYLSNNETAISLRKSKATYNATMKSSIFEYVVVTARNYSYFARKPVPLFKELILDTTNEGDTVCDPFCGSGTTAVACIETNRKFICSDINPEAVKLSKQRINDTTGALFG